MIRKFQLLIFFLLIKTVSFSYADPLQDLQIILNSESYSHEEVGVALHGLSADLVDNGNNSYGHQNFSWITPHYDSLINHMVDEDYFFHVYRIITREYGISCHVELSSSRRERVIEAINGLSMNSEYYLSEFNRFEPACSVK